MNIQVISKVDNAILTLVIVAYIFGLPIYEGSIHNLLIGEYNSYTN